MFSTPFAKTLAVIAVAIAILCGFVYLGFKPRYGPPDESKRLTHPAGFSIVEPAQWIHDPLGIFDGDTTRDYSIGMIEKKSAGMPASIAVTRLAKRPSQTESTEPNDTFQNAPAWKNARQRRKTTVTTFYFQSGDQWFSIIYDGPPTLPIADMMPYLNTFRFDHSGNATVAPTTRP